MKVLARPCRSAARGPRSYPRDDSRAWNVENVTVYEQLTSA
jgi:hypothetical protein